MLKLISRRSLFAFLCLCTLVGCGPQSETVVPIEDDAAQTEQTDGQAGVEGGDADRVADSSKVPEDKKGGESSVPKPIFPALSPGKYCYVAETDIETTHARLDIDASDRVTGDTRGVIHDEANSYYTSYAQRVDGTIDGSNLNLDVATWIEYDKQNEQETWKVSDDTLTVNGTPLTTESCATVNKVFQNEDGLEASDLVSDAKRVNMQQVSFNAGSTSTLLKGAVVRGDRDVYSLTARGGQQMKLSISSAEDNAAFDVVSPSGSILGRELTKEDIFLPDTGDYEIIVGGTRGNATYELSVEIKG